uniref:Transferase, Chloramphenicol acetyltransferase-like domain protein n=1 Tax=Lactuca sativa TaxID=4236 RepID=A0A9R1W9T8_LACSA|nr:hypothetical protein LSAT_V11C200078580 [Lactuca sativa]
MMRLFGSLLASSKVSKHPLLVLERSLAAYLVTNKQYSYEPRFFSAQPLSTIPQEFKFSQTHAGDKSVQENRKNGIRVMSIQHVKPDKPTPQELRLYKLSALDQINIPSYVPFIFFYPNNVNGNANINIDNLMVERSKLLRDSLSETLTRFYPFAGKYMDDNNIVCTDEGVHYVETQVDGDLSSFVAKPDYNLLQGLLPSPLNSTEPTRGQYLVMIQVNFFSCGGVAISMYNSHKLIDGRTYSTFLNAWPSAAKGDDPQKMVYPNFVSSSLFLPNTKAASNASCPLSFLAVRPLMLKSGKCSTKRFRFDSSTLQALKAKAAETVSSTRVVAVTSLIWKCATAAARKLNGERPSILQFALNIRGRFTPPIPENAIGNICWTGVANCELKDRLSLETMIGHVKAGIAKVDSSYLEKFKGEHGSDYIVDGMKRLGGQMSSYDADYYSSSSMCNSGLYEADFGWGRPVWSCYGNFNDNIPLYANIIILMDTRKGDGVEAWVTLGQEEMDILENDPDLLLYASVEPSPLQA